MSPHLKQTGVPFLDRERNRSNLVLTRCWTEMGGGRKGGCAAGWDKIDSLMASMMGLDGLVTTDLGRGLSGGVGLTGLKLVVE